MVFSPVVFSVRQRYFHPVESRTSALTKMASEAILHSTVCLLQPRCASRGIVRKLSITIGNGYLATHGAFEENYFGVYQATLLYGVFDDISIGKEELANVPDWHPIKWNLRAGLAILRWPRLTAPDKAQELADTLHLTNALLEHWQDVAEYLRIPQQEETGLFEQFEGFFLFEPLNQKLYQRRHESYQVILGLKLTKCYRIIKQADVLAFLTLFHQQMDLKTKQVNWDYYYPITDHDYGSSLTPAFHVLLACQLGLPNTAYEMFLKGALVDLEDRRGNAFEVSMQHAVAQHGRRSCWDLQA